MSVLTAQSLHKHYGAGATRVEALRGVSLEVRPREFLAILGPSGAGKSTLLHLLGGVDLPNAGSVLLADLDLASLNDKRRSLARRKAIAFVFQKVNLVPTLSAVENVALPMVIDGVWRREARRRAAAAMEHVGIGHRLGHLPSQMSGGEQQRTAIARAMVIEPAVILADEPTGALDSENSRRVFGLLRKCTEENRSIVLATHDPQIAEYADRIILLHDGEIVAPAESRVVEAADPTMHHEGSGSA